MEVFHSENENTTLKKIECAKQEKVGITASHPNRHFYGARRARDKYHSWLRVKK